MLFKSLTVTALAGLALAQGGTQTPDLVTLLSNNTELSNLTSYLSLFPDFTQTLSGLQNITLLAPNNAAFANLLNSSAGAALVNNDTALIQALFSYHVLNGTYANLSDTQFIPTALQPPQFTNVTGGQRVAVYENDDVTSFVSGLLTTANVSSTLNFTNGIVHIIDNVLLIPQNISETAVQFNLTSIVGALTAANLATTLDGLSDVTVFVPNNAAFSAIGSALPNLTMEEVTSILTYHVINGTVGYSNMLSNGSSLPTLQGNNVTVTIEDDNVYVNGARVVLADVLIANGVVHVIDNVLNPGNATALPSSDDDNDNGSPAFGGASSVSEAPFTSGVPTPTSSLATAQAPQATATMSGGASSSAAQGAAVPMRTGAVGAAALFGGAALVMNM
jgi:uncharacterized surface protein with fasciclin (FAS1) repeats